MGAELLQFRGEKGADIWIQPWRWGKSSAVKGRSISDRKGRFGAANGRGESRQWRGSDDADQGLLTISDLPSRGTFGNSGCLDCGWGETEAEGTLDECVASKIRDPGCLFSLKCFVLSYGAISSSVELSWIPVLILASKSRDRKLLKKGWKVIRRLKSEHKVQSEWVIEARDTKPVNNIDLTQRAICLQYPRPLSFLMWRLNKAHVMKLKRIC